VNLKDDLGCIRHITEYSPKMWQQFIRQSVQRVHERELGLKVGDPELIGSRVCTDAVRKVVNSSKFDDNQKRMLLVAACNGIWTKARAASVGYIVDSMACDLCGKGNDTLHHRLWHCDDPDVCAAREQVASSKIIEKAKAAGPSSALFSYALWSHPGDLFPPPSENPSVFGIDDKGNHLSLDDIRQFIISGTVYTDGSCSQSWIPELRRAGWAFVLVSDAGVPILTVHGSVPRQLPQTPQAAEYSAVAALSFLATNSVDVWSDCLGVVKAWNSGSSLWQRRKDVYAGTIAETCFRRPGVRTNVSKICSLQWVKAHQSMKGLADMPAELRSRACGNDHADKAANVARELLQPKADKAFAKDQAVLAQTALTVSKLIATVLPLWPRIDKYLKKGSTLALSSRLRGGAPVSSAAVEPLVPEVPLRVVAPEAVEIPPPPLAQEGFTPMPRQKHDWQKAAGRWHCPRCRAYVVSAKLPEVRANQWCKGMPDAVVDDSNGHKLCEVTFDGEPITYCSRCGRWMAFRAHGITGVCKPATKEGKKILRTILVKKQHPLADKKGRQVQQQQQHFDKAPVPLKVPDKDAHHAQVIAKLCASQKRKYQPWHLANAELQPTVAEIAVVAEVGNDSDDHDQQEPSDEEFEDVFGHQHEDVLPPSSGAASSSGPHVPSCVSPGVLSVSDTQRLSISENKAKAVAKQAARRSEGIASAAQRTAISSNREKAVAKKRARVNQPVWDIVGHTADLFSLDTAAASPSEPPAEFALPKASSTVLPAPPVDSGLSLRPCKSKAKFPVQTQLSPTVPVFICETVQLPVVPVAPPPVEFVPPAVGDVEEDLAELNGVGVRKPSAVSFSTEEVLAAVSTEAELLLPEELTEAVDLEVLTDLLELHCNGFPVSWPQGFDASTAKALLTRNA
jgi:hypothetical protein